MSSLARDYGDVVRVRLAHRIIYFLFHPAAIEETLVAKNNSFIKHFALRLNPLVLGNGLLTSEREFWLRQRRLIQPAFQRQRIAAYAPSMVAAAKRLADRWKPGEARDIQAEMMQLTLEIAAKTLFDSEVADEARMVGEAMQIMQDHFLKRFNSLLNTPPWFPTPANLRFRRTVRKLDRLLYGFIEQRRRCGTPRRDDLLSILLHARDEDDGSRMNDKQLRDEAMTLFLAGHETTALALSWTWYLLSQNPTVEAQLVDEWARVLGERDPSADDWPRLPVTESVIQESMRLFPPAYVVGREATEDVDVAGYAVRCGTTLLMPQWVVHRDPRWFDEPLAFRPERWRGEDAKTLPKYAYFPFGGGPRACIGNLFAMMEMVLVLPVIGRRFRFALQPGAAVTPQATFTLRPLHGIPGILRVR
jgi:cytochrome P450